MADKILDTIKVAIGGSVIDTGFDENITLLIDGCLADLNQHEIGQSLIDVNGVQTPARLRKIPDMTWDQFFGGVYLSAQEEAIKYIFLKTKLMFDPPLPATITYYDKAASEAIWRARLEYDNT